MRNKAPVLIAEHENATSEFARLNNGETHRAYVFDAHDRMSQATSELVHHFWQLEVIMMGQPAKPIEESGVMFNDDLRYAVNDDVIAWQHNKLADYFTINKMWEQVGDHLSVDISEAIIGICR